MSDNAFVECQWLSARFWHFLDERDYGELVKLFAPGGVWLRQGKELHAPDEILEAMARRSPALAIRHVMTNADVRTVDDRTAQVFSYALPYRHELAEPDQHPVPLHGPSALLVVRDTYERHDGLWLLARKESRRVMVAG